MKKLAFLLLTATCWGPSYFFIKIGVEEIPPFTLVFLRVAIAALILHVYCRLKRLEKFHWKQHWKHYLILGLTLNVLPFCMISYGEMYISSSLTGIINSMTLIFTTILAYFFGFQETFSKQKMMGMISGIVGLMVIYLPLIFQGSKSRGVGVLMMLLACLCYGIGTVYVRSHLQKIKGVTVLTAQLSVAMVILLPLIFLFDLKNLSIPSFQGFFSVTWLGIIATALGFFFYYKVIELAGSTYASFISLLVPVFSMILGVIVLHEKLEWNHYLGAFFILTGVFVMNFAKKIRIDSPQSLRQ